MNNVANVTNVYTKTVVVNNVTVNNVSYNGGAGGLSVRPAAEEQTAKNEKHVARTPAQIQHVQTASTNHQLYESVNQGKPAIAATAKPAEFSAAGVVAAKAAAPSYKPATVRAAAKGTAPEAATRTLVGHPLLQPMLSNLSLLNDRSRHRKSAAGPEVHATAGQAKRDSGTGAAAAPEEAGSGPPAVD